MARQVIARWLARKVILVARTDSRSSRARRDVLFCLTSERQTPILMNFLLYKCSFRRNIRKKREFFFLRAIVDVEGVKTRRFVSKMTEDTVFM